MSLAADNLSRRFALVRGGWHWLPLVVLPSLVLLTARGWPAWAFMWTLAFSIYAGLKWLTLADCPADRRASRVRRWGYLWLWPGMDARAFLATNRDIPRPTRVECLAAVVKTLLGLLLTFGVARWAASRSLWSSGWIGMVGMVCVLHFGLFHILSVAWRRVGIDAPPLMNRPLLASSLSDFWSRRWNLAFRDLANAYVLRPLARRSGVAVAMFAVYLLSGIVHDLVISLPAQGGYGLPTLYFVIQGVGLLVERSGLGQRIGLGRGWGGRLFAAAVTIAPAGLLFHRPFIDRVVVPMLTTLGAL